MKNFMVTAVLLLLLPTFVAAQKKAKKPVVPAVFAQARFVYVQAVDGEEFDRNLYPEDRMAVADLRDALEAWGRYTLTVDRDKADLIFVVRKGRLASADARGVTGAQAPMGGQYPGRPQQQGTRDPQDPEIAQGPGFGAGGEVGPPDDLFQVCQLTPNGKLGGPLWIRSTPNGLDAPRLLLFTQFKEAVDKAYPNSQQPSPAPKP